jgi:hypothetical protein
MPYTIEKIPDAPIVIMVREQAKGVDELPEVIEAVTAVLDAQAEPVYLILDIHAMELGIDELTSAATRGARGPSAVMHHPKIRENLVVSGKTLVKLAMQGLRTATFGNVKVRVFDSQENALAFCREQIAPQEGSQR